MAQIFPFHAYRYNPERVEYSRVLTQPYDKITPEMQKRYYALDPHNLVRIEKGEVLAGDSPAGNVYTRAARTLEEWISTGILLREAEPAIYVYGQEYAVPGGKQHKVRKGFIALSKLEDYAAGVVFRHELTHSGPKADRLELLRHTRAHTGQLFMLYPDREARLDEHLRRISTGPAAVDFADEFGVTHRLWPVREAGIIGQFVRAMAREKLIIADGHHRYETALAYRDGCRAKGATAADAAHERVMMTFFSARSEGLTLLPTHRILGGFAGFNFREFRNALDPYFDWYAYPFSGNGDRAAAEAEFCRDLALRGRPEQSKRRAIGVYAGGGAYYLFVLRQDAHLDTLLAGVPAAQRALDVVILHGVMLQEGLGITAEAVEREQNIRYEREMQEGLAAVDRGDAQMACLLNPVSVEQVCELALAGQVLPQKSTDFYPKLLSGMAIQLLEE